MTGASMKTIFFLTNLVGGTLVLLLGLVVILNETHNPAAMGVGFVAVVLAAACVWLAKECIAAAPNPVAQGNKAA